jgi:hypothetical protein
VKLMTNFFICRAKASTDYIILFLRVRFIIFTLCNGCAFTYMSSMKPSCIMRVLIRYIVYPTIE